MIQDHPVMPTPTPKSKRPKWVAPLLALLVAIGGALAAFYPE